MNLFEYVYPRFYFDKSKPLRLFEAFSGIGTQASALKKLGVNLDHVGISEIDKYAIASYNAIHGDVKNYGDICKINGGDLPRIDIFTYSFPCTDLSKAGQQAGMEKGTRSGLVWEVIRILKEMPIKPQVLLMENVVDLVQVKFVDGFNELQAILTELGYQNWNETLNSKDYSVAQNRDRIFMVSILGDYSYTFPNKVPLMKSLADYLEPNVDEKYYISKKMMTYLTDMTDRNGLIRGNMFKPLTKDSKYAYAITTKAGNRASDNFIAGEIRTDEGLRTFADNIMGTLRATNSGGDKVIIDRTICLNSKVDGKQPSLQDRIYGVNGVSTAITTGFMPSIAIPEATIKGYAEAHEGDGVYLNRPHQKRGVVQKGMIQTIKTNGSDVGVVVSAKGIATNESEEWQKKPLDGMSRSLLGNKANCGVGVVVESNKNLKQQLCDSLIDNNKVKGGEIINHSYTSSKTRPNLEDFIECENGIMPTLTTRPDVLGYVENKQETLRIRKLTPRECWRLMGMSDEDFDKAQAVPMSNAQLYRQAGNAIVVDVLEAIFKNLFNEKQV